MRTFEPRPGRVRAEAPHVEEETLAGRAVEHILIGFAPRRTKPHVRLATRLSLANVDRLCPHDALASGEGEIPIAIAERAGERHCGLDEPSFARWRPDSTVPPPPRKMPSGPRPVSRHKIRLGTRLLARRPPEPHSA